MTNATVLWGRDLRSGLREGTDRTRRRFRIGGQYGHAPIQLRANRSLQTGARRARGRGELGIPAPTSWWFYVVSPRRAGLAPTPRIPAHAPGDLAHAIRVGRRANPL